MHDIDLTPRLMQKMSGRARVRGRYNASELFFITQATGPLKTTPETWMKQRSRLPKEVMDMWRGIGLHSQIENLVGKENSEKKAEFFYRDITLVGMADYLPTHVDEVWEWKTSEKLMGKAKPWHEHQVKLYTTMFKRPRGAIYQPVQNDQGLYLKHLGTVDRDDEWFQKELEKLYEFHLLVEKLWEAKS